MSRNYHSHTEVDSCSDMCKYASVGLLFLGSLFFFIRKNTPDLSVVIDSAASTPINVHASTVTADWIITLSFQNNNNGSMYYRNVRASLFYTADTFLANTTLASFAQSDGVRTVMNAIFLARNVRLDDWAVDAIVSEMRHGAAHKFYLKLEAQVIRNPGASAKMMGSATVLCDDVKIRISNSKSAVAGMPGKLDGGSSKCLLELKDIDQEEINGF